MLCEMHAEMVPSRYVQRQYKSRVPHPWAARVGSCSSSKYEMGHAEEVEAILRTRRLAFSDVQLLSAAGLSRDETSQGPISERTEARAAGVWISLGRIRGDAESRAFADERTGEADGVDGLADAQAAGCAEDEGGTEDGRKSAGICIR